MGLQRRAHTRAQIGVPTMHEHELEFNGLPQIAGFVLEAGAPSFDLLEQLVVSLLDELRLGALL